MPYVCASKCLCQTAACKQSFLDFQACFTGYSQPVLVYDKTRSKTPVAVLAFHGSPSLIGCNSSRRLFAVAYIRNC